VTHLDYVHYKQNGGKLYPTEYARNAEVENFAESVAQYVTNHDEFVMNFPNRAELFERILK
jgi:hypothetical protein